MTHEVPLIDPAACIGRGHCHGAWLLPWENAEIFEALRTFPSIADRYLTTLDRTVGFAGRALLF